VEGSKSLGGPVVGIDTAAVGIAAAAVDNIVVVDKIAAVVVAAVVVVDEDRMVGGFARSHGSVCRRAADSLGRSTWPMLEE